MANLYTALASQQLPASAANTWSRSPGVQQTGDITYLEAVYTLTSGTDEATGDVIRICKLPANFVVIPHLCKIVSEATGTAFSIAKIGDLSVDGVSAPDDDARYSSGTIDIKAGGAFDLLYAGTAAGLAGYTTTKEMWLTATLGTITSPTAGKKIRFVIAGAVPS